MATPRRKRTRGSVEELPSGSFRVKVYAGYDPLTGRRLYLDETIPPGPKAAAEAERTRIRMLSEVDDRRNPTTRATVAQLMERYLEVVDVDPNTKKRYEGIIRIHIRPALGSVPLARLDGDLLDRFYAQLRACRERCEGKGHQRHRTHRAHECDERCQVKQCRPLSASSIRATHWVMSGALGYALRWRWLNRNPIESAKPPAPVRSKPSPPTPDEAAQLINEAWKDEDWGAFIWTAMTTGARRGELCAVQRNELDLDVGVMAVRTGLKRLDGSLVRRDTKTHQQRRIALDQESVAVLRELIARQDARAAQLQITVRADAFLFSPAPDCSTPLLPDTATHKYDRMAERLGIQSTLHKLRHYSATELIAAGVDIRTVAGRLGHGGGGATTLKVYAAWLSEADQRAAEVLGNRMPRPTSERTDSGAQPLGEWQRRDR
jgi:integrase